MVCFNLPVHIIKLFLKFRERGLKCNIMIGLEINSLWGLKYINLLFFLLVSSWYTGETDSKRNHNLEEWCFYKIVFGWGEIYWNKQAVHFVYSLFSPIFMFTFRPYWNTYLSNIYIYLQKYHLCIYKYHIYI